MKYIKTYELKETFYVSMVKKDDIRNFISIIDELKQKKISFKVYEPSERSQKYYYIIAKKPFAKDWVFKYNDNSLEDYGDEIDYEIIINMKKYNL